MHSYKKSVTAGLVLSLMLWTLGATACSDSTQRSNAGSIPASTADSGKPISAVLNDVVSGVGQVSKNEGSGTPKIFVFEETHTSIASQFEIALMLLRLHDRHGLRHIALEGLTKDKNYPSLQWYREMGGPENNELRNHVAVSLMRAGEISAVEFMTMIFSDVVVHGADDPSAYHVKLTDAAGNAVGEYLMQIALKSRDGWAQQQSEELNQDKRRSIEEMLEILKGIEKRAASVGARVSEKDRRGMADAIAFFEAAKTRSRTMVDTIREIGNAEPLVAVNIGAAHTSEMVGMFQSAKATYGVLTPLALARGQKAGDLTGEAYQRKCDLLSVAFTGKGLGSLLDGRRKYPPIGDRQAFQSGAQLRYAVARMVRAAVGGGEGGGKFPDSIPKDEINSLPYVKVDWTSLRKEQNGDVSFRADVMGDKGSVTINVRAGMPNGLAAAERRKGQALEQLLIENLEEIRKEPGERKEPAKAPVVEAVTPDVAAAFSRTPQALKTIKISG